MESQEVSHAVTMLKLCLDSRLLLVAGESGQLTLFRFAKTENSHEITVRRQKFSVLNRLCYGKLKYVSTVSFQFVFEC